MVRFTEAEVVEVWDRWQAGDANRLIGRDLGRSAASIRAFVESWGGVRPRVRRRAERHLSLIEGRRSLVVLLGVTRCGWWQPGWVVPRQPSRGSWLVTAAGSGIGLIVPTGLPYVGADVLNHRAWRPIINF